MDTEENIRRFLLDRSWVADVEEVDFLAAGEYNENYRVRAGGRTYVFRINHGSQLGLGNQIEYEYRVLKSLEDSGVTPRPFNYELGSGLGGRGVLLMEYFEGVPLDYERDCEKAARIFASVHRQPLSDELIVQARPVYDIAGESLGLINRFADHPLTEVRGRLLRYHEEVVELGRRTEGLFRDEPLCIVNTEVNSRNFIVDGEEGHLVDWEKAVISSRYQDLGHFVVPTTTLWKSDFRFDRDSRLRFLQVYADLAGTGLGLEEVSYRTEVLEKTILLRAMSWCFMAYYEYTRSDRTLTNNETFDRIQMYLRDIECFLN
jgi:aminoglycoside phosphotransferase (APT) family kinase protein